MENRKSFLSVFKKNKDKCALNAEPNLDSSIWDKGLRLMRDNRLRRLLDSRHKIIPEELKQLGIEFTKKWFILVLIKVKDSKREPDDDLYRKICRTVEDALNDSTMVPWVFTSEWDIYAIVNFNSDTPELQRLKLIDSLEPAVAILQEEETVRLRAFVSRLGDDISEISNQHQSVSFLCDYETILSEEDIVLTFERMTALARERSFRQDGLRSIEETERFFSAIERENYREAKDIMDNLADYLLCDVDISIMPLSLAKARLGYLINLLDIAVDALRLRIDSTIFSDMFPRLNFRECDNAQDFKNLADQIFDELIQHWRDNGNENTYALSWVSDVKRYVDLHFTDLSMNVNYLAMEFDLNPSYMSRVFRAKVGTSLPDYIQEIRLREAKSLLSSGTTVTETAERVGFGSVRSMNRAFQKAEGITPGKFKILNNGTKG